uniref:Alpha 1,4-glycosyltransferase domain-containing protein n=1 Tax=Rhodosorus marinus TaxID=101924 RepID=A0A7S3EAM1_9RHOD|mmetsp:Transcript_21611/g.88151  ORF Transcript_21611/g.88151 Transcript_21611/m.88151 type:complete len:289 (+) Transcript_21611:177-1043(+)|eukprot:CAMPEP_0113960460 /NCGR_PEP_ID=MMETSP0011_2-20120614/4723_1 /TAXON_ID=101924 /ORGANISM="Rhodosorus marinus" /LENGTH=288 /DNA_ID=CAMNT_0000971907 /DNA_START=142 /DNA_END=1008 /DNA_ORIENTATION=- /assembly_acc=CAM_ASM_000156
MAVKRGTRLQIKSMAVAVMVLIATSAVAFFVLFIPRSLFEDGTKVDTAWRSEVPDPREFYMSNIPKVIWQTVKSHNVPDAAAEAGLSWSTLNPTWDRVVLDDAEVLEFVKHLYNETEYQIFEDIPLGGVKAEFFRYMVIYQFGGVYADADTTTFKRIEDWIDPDCEFVVAPEDNDIFFCQRAFAAAPRHPIFKRLVERIFERLSGDVDYTDEHFVQEYTGPAAFTHSIREVLGISPEEKLQKFVLEEEARAMRKNGICWKTREELDDALKNAFAHDDGALTNVDGQTG